MSTMKKLLECISDLADDKLNLLLEFVLQLLPAEEERPCCPHCGNAYVIKYGRKDGKQRFQCKKCLKTFMLTTNTIAAESHQPLSVWREFVADSLHLRPMDDSAQCGLPHNCSLSGSGSQVLAALLFPPHSGDKVCRSSAHLIYLFLPTHFHTITLKK